jgi:tRNA(Arg) A34 adenosine deaminase TadA/DNA-binding NarL/FixJ family response regulator
MHILIVEKNDVTRKLIVGILNKKGYDTFEAVSGDDAQHFLSKDLALIVLDIETDDMGSMGLIRKLQMTQSRIPIVAMTEDTDHAAVQERLDIPRVAILQKPVMPDNLLRNIEDSLVRGVEKKMAEPKPPRPPTLDEKDPALKMQREGFMRRAIDISQQKMDENCGGPFGAVIVKNGKIIAEGWNSVTSDNDPTAHAEVNAIRAAASALKDFNLSGCEIYTSCEPCPMCLAALYWARIDRIFYGNTREDAAKIGFDDDMIYREFAVDMSKRSLPARMFLRDEAKIVFDNWTKKPDRTEY